MARPQDEAEAKALEACLDGIVRAARSSWPGVRVDPREFVAYLAVRLREREGGWVEGLRNLHASDLYLACACAGGDKRALALLDQRFLGDVAGYVASTHASATVIDEIKQ